MNSALVLRTARRRARLTLRALAERAGTSHATLVDYEAGRRVPRVDTFDRVLRAAGFAADIDLSERPDAPGERRRKGEELEQALRLAESFPAEHLPVMRYPVFGRVRR